MCTQFSYGVFLTPLMRTRWVTCSAPCRDLRTVAIGGHRARGMAEAL